MVSLAMPTKSQDHAVLEKCNLGIDPDTFISEAIDIEEIKDFLLRRPLGILVLVTSERAEYKIFCMNALRLHYCQITESLYEIVGNDSWQHSLASIKYYDFIPHERWKELDTLKSQICSHLTSVLLEGGKVNFVRKTKYFYAVSMKA